MSSMQADIEIALVIGWRVVPYHKGTYRLIAPDGTQRGGFSYHAGSEFLELAWRNGLIPSYNTDLAAAIAAFWRPDELWALTMNNDGSYRVTYETQGYIRYLDDTNPARAVCKAGLDKHGPK